MQRWHGIGSAHGVAVGPAFIIDRRRITIRKEHIDDQQIDNELQRLASAIEAFSQQLEQLKQKLAEQEQTRGGIGILEIYQLILQDDYLLLPIRQRIRESKINAEWALSQTIREIREKFDGIGVEYFRERRSDVDFVGEQLLRNLTNEGVGAPLEPPKDAIIVAYDLSPADIIHLHRAKIAGILTASGGKTSHTAILAQAFLIPTVVGADEAVAHIGVRDIIILDGTTGEIIVHPSAALIEQYQSLVWQERQETVKLLANNQRVCETQDHIRLQLLANVEFIEELPITLQYGAEGIGLYRTEFLFLDRTLAPTEEEHFAHAKEVLQKIAPLPVTFRTFDLGADKIASFLLLKTSYHLKEPNPALGLRSLRLCLKERSLFKAQIRGLLRASVFGNMSLMFPMISGLSELLEAKEVLEECKYELKAQGIPIAERIPLGIMIEMPSAVMVADHLAQEVSFLSIGTNDLIQYSLAIDRVNEHLSYLYQPLHPAILRMIKQTVDLGHSAKVKVGLCGEMAANPSFVKLLIGCGLDNLSMHASALLKVKDAILHTSFQQACELTSEILSLKNPKDIERRLKEENARKG